MNTGTIIRTLLVIATSLNTALIATDVTGFASPTLDLIYKILSVASNFVIVFCATWYNNDYTPEASIGTGIARQMKLEAKEGYEGEVVFDDAEEIEDGEDDE
jgi:hypothetical protein